MIERQLQNAYSGQSLLPMLDLLLKRFAVEALSLPHSVINVLNGERRHRRGLSGHECLVVRHYFAHEHAHGPAIADDVMHR